MAEAFPGLPDAAMWRSRPLTGRYTGRYGTKKGAFFVKSMNSVDNATP